MKKSRSLWMWPVVFVAGFVAGIVFSAWKLDIAQHQCEQPQGHPSAREARLSEGKQRIAALEKMLEKNPKNVQAVVQLGNAYLSTGRNDEAVAAFQKALELTPQDPDVLTQLGVSYRRLGKSSDAAESFRRALKLNPGHPFALVNLGIVLQKDLGDKKGALKAFEALLASSEGSRFSKMVTPWVEQLRKEIAPKESNADKK